MSGESGTGWVSAFVDTSVVVRYLTADPPEMVEAARRIVDDMGPLLITDVVLAETAFVILSFYGVPRSAICALSASTGVIRMPSTRCSCSSSKYSRSRPSSV